MELDLLLLYIDALRSSEHLDALRASECDLQGPEVGILAAHVLIEQLDEFALEPPRLLDGGSQREFLFQDRQMADLVFQFALVGQHKQPAQSLPAGGRRPFGRVSCCARCLSSESEKSSQPTRVTPRSASAATEAMVFIIS